MEGTGQPAPEYRQNEFMVYATIRQHGDVVGQLNGELNGELNASQKATLQFIIEHEGCSASGISEMTKIPFSTIDKHVRERCQGTGTWHRHSAATFLSPGSR